MKYPDHNDGWGQFWHFLKTQFLSDPGGIAFGWGKTEREYRSIGPGYTWYDGPHFIFGLWWWTIEIGDFNGRHTDFFEFRDGLKEVIGDDYVIHLTSSNSKVRWVAESIARERR